MIASFAGREQVVMVRVIQLLHQIAPLDVVCGAPVTIDNGGLCEDILQNDAFDFHGQRCEIVLGFGFGGLCCTAASMMPLAYP